jgi:hypothetical protein
MEVYVLLYASGYTSETYTEVYADYSTAKTKYLEKVKSYCYDDIYNRVINEDFTSRDEDDVYIGHDEVSWDGGEVYERIELYKQDVI